VLRVLLGRYLGMDPSAVRFATGPHGKPELAERAHASATEAATTGAIEPSSVSFNLSHSDTVALYCFARGMAVGVDVEVDRRPIDELALAERMLDTHTVAQLRTLSDPAQRRREFLRAWTRHEAQLKCLGTGIGASERPNERPPWVTDLDLGNGIAGAIACEHTPVEPKYWSWDEQLCSHVQAEGRSPSAG
jgi:4'-phosphopantetheinyl transferase